MSALLDSFWNFHICKTVRITILTTLALAATAFAQIKPNNAGAKNVGQGDGSQFITGGCVDDSDCSSACCANASGVGVCSAEAAQFQNGKNGCNFVDPNRDATIAAAKAQVEKQGF
ncbi:hypothetical protein CCHL11_03723 [Colletotrichum chlorophyti]|uniref:Biotrophy-associated secreted protein 2 n=1 Tax=Colletotrichum chlorophyti TaxID=708187 RepID=A0A1Q8RQY8_9PEZI|nr:hypothetical protein CCHL11_03723 [Colletotrichum chlorophyti]